MTAEPPALEQLRAQAAEQARSVAALRVQVRRAVEGLLGGLHPSRMQGASAVFAEHLPYRPGDEPRWIDWKATARTERVVVRRFELESRLQARLLLDVSASMRFSGCEPAPGAPSKAWHGAVLLGALGWLLREQGDAVGGGPFASELLGFAPPRQHPSAWERLAEAWLQALEAPAEERAAAEPRTRAEAALQQAMERAPGRGLLVVATDLLQPLEPLRATLRAATRLGEQAWVLHVLHPDEMALPPLGPSRFVDPEGGAEVLADPLEVAGAYRAELDRFLAEAERACHEAGARYVLAPVDEPAGRALARLLSWHAGG